MKQKIKTKLFIKLKMCFSLYFFKVEIGTVHCYYLLYRYEKQLKS